MSNELLKEVHNELLKNWLFLCRKGIHPQGDPQTGYHTVIYKDHVCEYRDIRGKLCSDRYEIVNGEFHGSIFKRIY
jgi:hypothetical protein